MTLNGVAVTVFCAVTLNALGFAVNYFQLVKATCIHPYCLWQEKYNQEIQFWQYIIYGDIFAEVTENYWRETPHSRQKAIICPILSDNWKTGVCKLVLFTNMSIMRSHTNFRLVSKSMTVNDLERHKWPQTRALSRRKPYSFLLNNYGLIMWFVSRETRKMHCLRFDPDWREYE